jgi:hypothetical protein
MEYHTYCLPKAAKDVNPSVGLFYRAIQGRPVIIEQLVLDVLLDVLIICAPIKGPEFVGCYRIKGHRNLVSVSFIVGRLEVFEERIHL